MEHLSLSDWAAEDRPTYKLVKNGSSALTNVELLSIIIGSGTKDKNAVDIARNVLSKHNNSLRSLMSLHEKELQSYEGIGEMKVAKVQAALELGKRMMYENEAEKPLFSDASVVWQYIMPRVYGLSTEEFWVLPCNNRYRLIGAKPLFKGGLSEVIVDVRLVLKEALMLNATTLFVCHNHPSGSIQPSKHDDQITQDLAKAARLLNIHFVDHVIVTNNAYYSYSEQGRL